MVEEKGSLIWLLLIVAGLAVILAGVMAGPLMPGMMGMMGFGWGFMWLIPLAFLILIVIGAYFLITGLKTAEVAPSGAEKALEILKERYARGEITREEYLRMKEDIES